MARKSARPKGMGNVLKLGAASVFVSGLVVGGVVQAGTLILPKPDSTITWNGYEIPVARQMGDFYSYNLQVLYFLTGNKMYDIPAAPGQIADEAVLFTGTTPPVDPNPLGMDNAYESPNSPPGDTTPVKDRFSTDLSLSYPGAELPGVNGLPAEAQKAGSWDTTLSALQTEVTGGALVFLFNHNQIGNSPYEDLYGLAQVRVWKSDGTTEEGEYFDFFSEYTNFDVTQYASSGTFPTGPFPVTATLPPTNPYASDLEEWVWSPGQYPLFDVNNNPVIVNGSQVTVNTNVGVDSSAYAIWSPELQSVLDNNPDSYEYMSVTVRLAKLNNGYEQAFIHADSYIVPLPSSVWMGMGLLGAMGAMTAVRKARANRA